MIRQEERVVATTGNSFDFEVEIQLARTGHEGNLVSTVVQVDTVCFCQHVLHNSFSCRTERARVALRFGTLLRERWRAEIDSSLITDFFLQHVHLPTYGKVLSFQISKFHLPGNCQITLLDLFVGETKLATHSESPTVHRAILFQDHGVLLARRHLHHLINRTFPLYFSEPETHF